MLDTTRIRAIDQLITQVYLLNRRIAWFIKSGRKRKRFDCNSVLLLLLLILPAGTMVLVSCLGLDLGWVAGLPYTSIELLGSFAAILLAVFIVARYQGRPGIVCFSAGLMAIGIIDGFRAISSPGSNEFIWLHALAGILGGLFFAFYAVDKLMHRPILSVRVMSGRVGLPLAGAAMLAILCGVFLVTFSDILPPMLQTDNLTAVAWVTGVMPVTLFLFAGIVIHQLYRKTGASELLLFTAVLIFLFQAHAVFYPAIFRGVLWWVWQAFQFTIYLIVLGYIFKNYIKISGSLAVEVSEREKIEAALQKAKEKERQLQHELKVANRLASLGEIAASTTHEINNQLTGVIGFAQMLTQMNVPKDIIEAAEVISEGTQRIAGLVGKLLTFSRRGRPVREYTNVNSLVDSAVEMRSYELRNNNIEVITHFAPDLPHTMVNVGQLQQVFLNIIINAEQAIAGTNNGGKIIIKTCRENNDIKVAITDTGCGIAKDYMGKIFDPFFTTKERGTGLGLSVSQTIIKEHSGNICVESESGKGATFIIELPIIAERKQIEIARPSVSEPRRTGMARIMVVDDEPNICRVLDRLLTREGHEVEAISNAQVALQRLNTARCDLILLDIKMPGMDGIEFYEMMKGIDPSLERKTVCITGDAISARNRAFLENTKLPYITKPFTADKLLRQVKLALERREKDAQNTYSYCGR